MSTISSFFFINCISVIVTPGRFFFFLFEFDWTGHTGARPKPLPGLWHLWDTCCPSHVLTNRTSYPSAPTLPTAYFPIDVLTSLSHENRCQLLLILFFFLTPALRLNLISTQVFLINIIINTLIVRENKMSTTFEWEKKWSTRMDQLDTHGSPWLPQTRRDWPAAPAGSWFVGRAPPRARGSCPSMKGIKLA